MKKVLFIYLVILSIVFSSSVFSAIPQGKFPIQIVTRNKPNPFEAEMINQIENAFRNSPNYRITNIDENRIVASILIFKLTPGVLSTDWLASAVPVHIYSIAWLAKPKDKHAYYIWHDSGNFTSSKELIQHILEEADIKVWTIKNKCPYVFD